jgi:hypothetical protein
MHVVWWVGKRKTELERHGEREREVNSPLIAFVFRYHQTVISFYSNQFMFYLIDCDPLLRAETFV